MNPYFRDFQDFISEAFPGAGKLQKLTVDAGFTCPNRDGKIGSGGCIYCNNESFSPVNGEPVGTKGRKIVSSQELKTLLENASRFFSRKYPAMDYLAYFQSYTNTYAPVEVLMSLYKEALETEGIKGLVIGTRPDCVSEELLDALNSAGYGKKVVFELGAETSHDITLREINRGHTWSQTCKAVELIKSKGFMAGLHFIFGLPGETPEMMFETVEKLRGLPVDIVKYHHLQILKNTKLCQRYLADKSYVKIWELEDYLDFCVELVKRHPKHIAIERFVSSSPANMLVAPKWGLKNYEFTNLLMNKLKKA